MKTKLDAQVPSQVVYVCRVLRDAGHEAWLVGGAVRDGILGRSAHDWDIATDAHPKTILEIFPHVIETGIKHGTVTVLIGGEGYEVTTYRGDGDYSDGRRPNGVHFLNTIEEDLARRDFTINAIAYDPLRDVFADPYGGQRDIECRVIKAVGDPLQRFTEDGLRVLRAARFEATLEFDLDPDTKKAIRPSLETYKRVSVERVQAEWFKMMRGKQPSRAFRIMEETGILEATVPEFVSMVGCIQNKYHSYDVWEHTLKTVDACPADGLLRVAALFHDVGKPVVKGFHPTTGDATFYDHEVIGAEMTGDILTRLKFSTEDKVQIEHLVRHHFIRYEAGGSEASIRRWVRKVGLENVTQLCTLARADIAGKGPAKTKLESGVIDELESRIATMQTEGVVMPTSTKVLAINGKDVMDHLGIPSGPEVGRILSHLLDVVTEDPGMNTRGRLLEAALRC